MNMKNVKVPKIGGAALKLGIIGGIGLYSAAKSQYYVDGGHRAIVINRLFGVKDKVYPEGPHFVIPWFERPVIYDVRSVPHLVKNTTWTRDLHMVTIELEVLAHPLGSQLPTIYRTLGKNNEERLLPSIGRVALKDVVSQYSANQLIAQPEAFVCDFRKKLTERAADFNIALDDVSIIRLDFGLCGCNHKQTKM